MTMFRQLLAIGLIALGLAGVELALAGQAVSEADAEPRQGAKRKPAKRAPSKQTGLAAFYHADFHGRRTASGETFDHNGLTAAHKTLPFGTLVRVINLRNNKSVVVRVNDRGPVQADRVIDVTPHAARLLGFFHQGMTRVALEVVPPGSVNEKAPAHTKRGRS